MKLAVLLIALASSLWGADGGRIVYSKEHPGNALPYIQITVEQDGSGVYRESVDDPDDIPIEFQLRPEETEAIFQLAKKLDYFRKPLESNLKVANMGIKTFRWEGGEDLQEQKFNFSKDANARILADWFARIGESERHLINLERAVQFDKLGVNKILLQIQVSLEKNRLAAPDQFLPLLDKIAANESYLNMARSRAATLAQHIRSTGGDAR